MSLKLSQMDQRQGEQVWKIGLLMSVATIANTYKPIT